MTSHLSGEWRWRTKEALASVILHARDLGWAAHAARTRRRPLILGYHRVVEDFDAVARTEMPSMLISRDTFERHLESLAREFHFVSLDEIGERLEAGEPFDRPVAAVTFDDGYRDVYEQAFPLLRRKGIPAAMFVVSDLVGRQDWQIHDKLYYLLAKGFAFWSDPRAALHGLLRDLQLPADGVAASRDAMTTVSVLLPSVKQADVTRIMDALEIALGNGRLDIPEVVTWDMLRELQAGGFTIGSHTRSHRSLPLESTDVVLDELQRSKRDLERQLGTIAHFAYPGGQFTSPVVDAVSRAGYRFAYTACPHGDPRYPLLTQERLLLWERSAIDGNGRFSSPMLRCHAHGLWPPSRRCGRKHAA